MALRAVYIKGFKTFARPVRMPLEDGVTAIVGPNGSGKSNITDAVLFALGEQSASVLRAGAMGDLIFTGSETLPASAAAEVTLVLDNEGGGISLPYREVSITRRISRAGDTEYRVNGSRSRLADVRAVAGEAGLGRHSILRQGAVDAIVAGGASACRLALEEAAGLGVYRQRRLSASRRLERASAQLEQSRRLEAELADQLRRIEREAVAAREYREIEARYRELSLAHLYMVASQGLEEHRRKLQTTRERVTELSVRETELREEEKRVTPKLRGLEASMRRLEQEIEGLEDFAEDLRSESLRSERLIFRIDSESGGEGQRRRAETVLTVELERVERVLDTTSRELEQSAPEHKSRRERREELRRRLGKSRQESAAAQEKRSRLAGELESLRGSLDRRLSRVEELSVVPQDHLDALAGLRTRIEDFGSHENEDDYAGARRSLRERRGEIERMEAEASRRRGALEAALGRAESRVRSLRYDSVSDGSISRLHEVIRPHAGYERAVEAALGEHASGVLAEDVTQGIEIVSATEPFALRLDARPLVAHQDPPGIPLLSCVDLVRDEYAEAVESLLGGIYVVEDPHAEHPENGHVLVTRDGLRLTRTSVSRRSEAGRFSRQARFDRALQSLDALKSGPGEVLFDLRETLSAATRSLETASEMDSRILSLRSRVDRAVAALGREAAHRHSLAERANETLAASQKGLENLRQEVSTIETALASAIREVESSDEKLTRLSSEAETAEVEFADAERRRSTSSTLVREGESRKRELAAQLERLSSVVDEDPHRRARLAERSAELTRRISEKIRERRGILRKRRSESAEEHRRVGEGRDLLSRQAVALAGDLATARAAAEHTAQELQHAETSSVEASEEIQTEWGTTFEDARALAKSHPGNIDPERHRLARKLKRFGDVNLLALSQQDQLRDRYELISSQRADAEEAANELDRIIRDVDAQIEERFSETFGRVSKAFGGMVPRMMEGAAGVLDLSEEGVEIGLRLGRKGWRPLRVLSGGERALLALSFLFSIFLSGPERNGGAFCILDEAEAALDDLNLARFLAVVDSYRSEGQFLLVTHQKRTMAVADVLYGVVQDATGATTVVSKRAQGE